MTDTEIQEGPPILTRSQKFRLWLWLIVEGWRWMWICPALYVSAWFCGMTIGNAAMTLFVDGGIWWSALAIFAFDIVAIFFFSFLAKAALYELGYTRAVGRFAGSARHVATVMVAGNASYPQFSKTMTALVHDDDFWEVRGESAVASSENDDPGQRTTSVSVTVQRMGTPPEVTIKSPPAPPPGPRKTWGGRVYDPNAPKQKTPPPQE